MLVLLLAVLSQNPEPRVRVNCGVPAATAAARGVDRTLVFTLPGSGRVLANGTPFPLAEAEAQLRAVFAPRPPALRVVFVRDVAQGRCTEVRQLAAAAARAGGQLYDADRSGWPRVGAEEGLQPIWVGGVRLLVPEAARLMPGVRVEAEAGVARGVRVALDARTVLEVAAWPKAACGLAAWLTAAVRVANATRDPVARLRPPAAERVADMGAWRLRPFCGDCEAGELYLDAPAAWVVVRWSYDGRNTAEWAQRRALVAAVVQEIGPE